MQHLYCTCMNSQLLMVKILAFRLEIIKGFDDQYLSSSFPWEDVGK